MADDRFFYQQIPQMRVSYNPYEIVEQRYNKYAQKKSSEPIMYDPSKVSGFRGTGPKKRNVAPPGSLLKVWEG